MITVVAGCLLIVLFWVPSASSGEFESDTLQTSAGNVAVTFIGHGSLMLTWNEKVIHIDPYGTLADYSALPKADLILVTHEHGDHLDAQAIAKIRSDSTRVILNGRSRDKLGGGEVMKNGDVRTFKGIGITAVPAYNLVHKRDNGEPYHPKGEGNGYLLDFGDTRIYVAGDTENTPEMKALKDIDYAFLPMNLPYTMTPEMVADAAKAIEPKVLYPYHFGNTDTSKLLELLAGNLEIEVRIRPMK